MSSQRISRRKFLGLCLIGSAGAFLAACAPSAPAPQPTAAQAEGEQPAATEVPAANPEPVKKQMTISWWTLPIGLPSEQWPHGKWEGELCERYTKEVNPDITVELQPLGWEALEKITASISSGAPPNLLGRGCSEYHIYALKSEVAVEVELEDDLKNDLPEGWYDGMLYQGKNFQVPWYIMAQGPQVNMTIAREAKAEDLLPKAPDYGWHYDQWVEFLKACTFKRSDGTDVYGCAVWTATSVPAYNWSYLVGLWNAGADNVQYDEAKGQWFCPLRDDASQAYLKLMQDLYFVHKVSPDPRGLDNQKHWDYWTSNTCAWAWPSSSIGNARAQGVTFDPETLIVTDPVGFDWIFVQNPTMPGVKHCTWGGANLDVNLEPFKTDDPDSIAPTIKFAHWVANKDNQKWLAQYQIPVRRSAVESVSNDPLLQWMFKNWVPNGRTRQLSGCSTETDDIFIQQWQKLFLPTDPKEVADEWVAKQDALDCWLV